MMHCVSWPAALFPTVWHSKEPAGICSEQSLALLLRPSLESGDAALLSLAQALKGIHGTPAGLQVIDNGAGILQIEG